MLLRPVLRPLLRPVLRSPLEPGYGYSLSALFSGGQVGSWYDTSDPATVYQDSAGTTVGVIGSPVGLRLDKSGNGNHATQATSTSRPLWKQDANGFLHEEFDGADDYLTSASGGGGNAGFFYCAAITPTGGAGTIRNIFDDRGSNTGYILRINITNALRLIAGNGVGITSVETATLLPVGETHVITAWDDGVNLCVQIDNGAVASIARPAVLAGTAGFTEGRNNEAASQYFNGRIYSRVYLKGASPDAATRELVKRRIAAKAGISLP